MQDVHAELGRIDLNLLVALDALLHERHVTRAARRLGLTQSAASHALARLRGLLDDPLLVRGPRGAMQPTPRALELGPAVHRALADLAAAVRGPAPFDPARARHGFRIGTSDYAELVVLPALAARLRRVAPGVDLHVTPVPDQTPAALARGDVDLVLALLRAEWSSGCYQRHLFDERFACAVRRGHPAAGRRLTLPRYCALDHVMVAPRGRPGGPVDDALAALGRSRRVAVTVPHFLIAPQVVAATDLVVTLAVRVLDHVARPLGLHVTAPPLDLPGFAVHMVWHERGHHDPALRWLRDQIAAVCT